MNTAKPIPPEFKLRRLGGVAYAMSILTGALGQVLFFSAALIAFIGNAWIAWTVALFLAAFAEAVMAAAGDLSLYHRTQHHAWIALLVLSVAVSIYAALMNIAHFWSRSTALAFTFGGASIVGFLLHLIDGHIRVAAFLRAEAAFLATQADAREKPARRPRSQHPTGGEPKAASTSTPPPAEVDAAPSEKTNVTPFRATSKTPSKREQAYQWFAAQVDANGGDVTSVTGPDIAEQFDADHLKTKISDFRTRYRNERAAANQ